MKKGVVLLGLVLSVLFLSGSVWAGTYGVYTVAELIADVQVITKGDRDLNDSIWLEIVNLGLDNLSSKADCAVETITVITAAATAEYALPTDFQKLWGVKHITDEFVYNRIGVENQLKSTTGFEVEREKVYFYARTLGFSKAPVGVDTVLVYYFKKPAVVDSTQDTLDILSQYNYALKIACRIEVWERIERYDKGSRDRTLLINEINNTKAYLASQPPDIIVGPRLIPRDAE